jgi:predicted PurR-regulated permease PerM
MLGFDFRIARIVWTVFLFALILFIAYSIRTTLLVIIFAIFFSYLVYPLVQVLEHYKPPRLSRSVIIIVAFIFVIAIIAIAVILFGTQMADEAANLGSQLPKLLNPTNLSERIPLPNFLEPLRPRLVSLLSDQLQVSTGQALPLVQRFGLGVVHALSNLFYLVVIPILSFLLIREAPNMLAIALSWLSEPNRALWTTIARDLHFLFAKFVRALLLLSLATFVSYSIVFSMLGVPYALFLAGIGALLEFIPVIGPLISAGIVVGVSAFSGYGHLLWLVAFFVGYRIFQDYVLSPYLMSEGVAVSPLFVIFGLLAGEQLGGVAGIFLSVPVLAALKIILIRARASSMREKITEHRRR